MKFFRLLSLMVTGAWFFALAGSSMARPMRSASYEELMEKSDLVVIASPTAVNDTKEERNLPDISAVRVTGVETKFAVSVVFKGDKALKEFTLHHYRQTKEGAVPNGPLLAKFDPAHSRSFLLFLVREADGRYAPVLGQTDPGFHSVHVLQGS
jgi:hypothetical protein